jgi:hypothetical protein
MRIPEPIPFGLTFLLAMTRAIVGAFLENVPSGGKVDTVLTLRTHRLLSFRLFVLLLGFAVFCGIVFLSIGSTCTL